MYKYTKRAPKVLHQNIAKGCGIHNEVLKEATLEDDMIEIIH